MAAGKILAEQVCRDLSTGYYFFEDVLDLEPLEFQNHRTISYGEDFDALVDSIKDHGVRIPIRATYDVGKEKIIVIAGERRTRAVTRLRELDPDGEYKLPVLLYVGDLRVKDTELDQTITSIVSNLMTQELGQVDKMRCFKMLYDRGMSKKEIVRCCGKDRKTVERSLQLAEFDHEALEFIEDKEKQGLLKARTVEIIGQKLKKSLNDVKRKDAPESQVSEEGPAVPVDAVIKAEPDPREREIRDAAIEVLREEVRRRSEAKKPKSDEEKQLIRQKRENSRRIDIIQLREALDKEFPEDQVQRILDIVDEVYRADQVPSPSKQIAMQFSQQGASELGAPH